MSTLQTHVAFVAADILFLAERTLIGFEGFFAFVLPFVLPAILRVNGLECGMKRWYIRVSIQSV